ncbi:hypothetical protein OAI28_03350 [Methylophilaceae bacterium]|jgi:hypothetical protein|nr:hypothetical protein [Methylophilaceae bacterium]
MKKFNYTLIFLLLISVNSFSQDFQYFIYERYYNHSDSMRPSPYGDLHVYLQGPMIEEAINRNLQSKITKCAAGVESKYIFLIEPQVFYNPSMTTLHGEFKIKIYTSSNVLKKTHIIKAQRQGRINQIANSHINTIYDKLLIKFSKEILENLPKDTLNINGDFCGAIGLSKPKNSIDKDYKKPIQA